MEAILMQWLYIIIAAVVCVLTWAIFAGKNNNWGHIPMLLRLPLLVVSVGLAVLAFLIVFSLQRLIPGLIEAFINIIIGIIFFFAGWNLGSVGAVVETISGIIGDIIVTPIVLGFIFIVGLFPNFPNDRLRNLLYKLLATLEVSVLTACALWDTEGQLNTLDSTIFTLEIVGCAIFVIYIIFSDSKKNIGF